MFTLARLCTTFNPIRPQTKTIQTKFPALCTKLTCLPWVRKSWQNRLHQRQLAKTDYGLILKNISENHFAQKWSGYLLYEKDVTAFSTHRSTTDMSYKVSKSIGKAFKRHRLTFAVPHPLLFVPLLLLKPVGDQQKTNLTKNSLN